MGISYSPDPMLAVNMFVWQDADALFEFVYRSAHTPVMAGRRDYFQKVAGAYQALWWLPAGEIRQWPTACRDCGCSSGLGRALRPSRSKRGFRRRMKRACQWIISLTHGAWGMRKLAKPC